MNGLAESLKDLPDKLLHVQRTNVVVANAMDVGRAMNLGELPTTQLSLVVLAEQYDELLRRAVFNAPEETPAAVFSSEDVQRLNEHQTRHDIHPYTCGQRHTSAHPPDAVLVATIRGWICPYCDYTQNWAHPR